MEEIDKYNKMLKDLNNKYSSYTEVDNRVDVKPEWCESDIVICVNNNFIENDESHGHKDGLSLGGIYKVLSIRDGQMIIITNDFYEDVPYFNWRFFRVPKAENSN
jgi:hypothetical protein